MSRTPEDIIGEFRRAIDLFVKVAQHERCQGERGSKSRILIGDAKIRLEQSHLLLTRFRRTELELPANDPFRHVPPGPNRDQTDRWNLLCDDIRLYGEAFYYFAFRVKDTLDVLKREGQINLTFDPIGVRTIRNRMIEHPDKHDGMYVLSWHFDCPEGLVLDGGIREPSGLDKGLYPNADEFIEKLMRKLAECPLIST